MARLRANINPHRLFEWDEPKIAQLPDDPTPLRLLQFLCHGGADASMGAFRSRYRAAAAHDQEMVVVPEEPTLEENVFRPLREAMVALVLDNRVGCVALCGLVAEKVTLLRHLVEHPDDEPEQLRFSALGQKQRERELKKSNRVGTAIASDLALIRESRRQTLHFWNDEGQPTAETALACYGAAVRVAMRWGIRLSFRDGAVILDKALSAYLAKHGVIRPDIDEV